MRPAAVKRAGGRPTARRPWRGAGAALGLLGVILLLGAGVLWLGGQAAVASAAHYLTAPVCAANVPAPCRSLLPATVVSWNTAGAGSDAQRTVIVRLSDGSTRQLVVAGGDLFAALQPDQAVQAEAWAGQIIRLSDDADHLLTTVNDPTQASYDNPGVALLLGGLGAALLMLGTALWYARR